MVDKEISFRGCRRLWQYAVTATRAARDRWGLRTFLKHATEKRPWLCWRKTKLAS